MYANQIQAFGKLQNFSNFSIRLVMAIPVKNVQVITYIIFLEKSELANAFATFHRYARVLSHTFDNFVDFAAN